MPWKYHHRAEILFLVYIDGNILATKNQQAIINDVIEVKTGVYLHWA